MSEKIKTYINVGLVGHVSNGKTTLVKALTGVNTKRNSSEIKSGRTIKLGYANCLVWKCQICESVVTTGQEQKQLECCSFDLEPCQYISFVDAPGHHSYVQTMIKGSAIIDCAIVVTDVRADKLQIQTMEHLAILEILGVRNVIVVQNKIDLTDVDQVRKNYQMLRRELKGTVADDSPIIPISAQSNIGICNLQEYIYRMVSKAIKNLTIAPNVFTIVRSFDINRPMTEPDKLKGGVIGGTIIGKGGYKIGDEIEIRPGFIHASGDHIPLKTVILSIFSESTNCTDMGRGGLYGVGTRLDPFLTKADGLVGCLAGKSEDLPPVVKEIKMQIFRMKKCIDGSTPPKIKKDIKCQLVIGSMVVHATVSKLGEEGYIAQLLRPVCITAKKCLIYSSDMQLIGFGQFSDVKEDVLLESNLPQKIEEYEQLLPGVEKKKRAKINIPIPELAKENMNTIWTNILVFCQLVNRGQNQVATYIKEELCMEVSMCQAGLRLYKSKIKVGMLQTVLKKYIKEKISCEQCKGIRTILEKNGARGFNVHCTECGSNRAE